MTNLLLNYIVDRGVLDLSTPDKTKQNEYEAAE